MGYKVSGNQREVPAGKIRFTFDLTINGNRYRNNMICMKSVVASQYREWERSIIEQTQLPAQPEKTLLFFEIDRYLEYADSMQAGKRMLGYTHTIFRYFKSFFRKDMKLQDFRRSDVQDYICWRKNQNIQRGLTPVSDRAINREIAELSKFFTYCIEREIYFKVNPCFRQKLKVNIVREVYLTPEQIDELLEVARKESESIFAATLIALSTGFRRGEVFDLNYKDIDFKHSRIFLRASTTKGNKSRIVAVPNYLIEFLQQRRENANDKQGRVFHEWRSEDWLRNAFERVRNRLSFNPLPNGTNLHFHDLRHVYAQCLRDQGVALQDIQAFLGHSSVTVTERFYAQAGGRDAKEKVEKLSAVIPFKREKVS